MANEKYIFQLLLRPDVETRVSKVRLRVLNETKENEKNRPTVFDAQGNPLQETIEQQAVMCILDNRFSHKLFGKERAQKWAKSLYVITQQKMTEIETSQLETDTAWK